MAQNVGDGENDNDLVLCSDGKGGAIAAWSDVRSWPWSIFAQRINTEGETMWTVNGETVCAVAGAQYIPNICIDARGGAIVAWYGTRLNGSDISVQRVNDDTFTSIISNTTGGIVFGDDGKTMVNIDPNALGENMSIGISTKPITNPIMVSPEDINTANSRVSTQRRTGIIREFIARDASTYEKISSYFMRPVEITIPYPDADDNGVLDATNIPAENLALYMLNENTKEWEKISYSVDKNCK